MNTLEKTELTASVHHIAIFLKSGIPIYNTENPDTPGRKTVKKEKKKNTGNCKAFCVLRKRKNLAILTKLNSS